MEATGPRQVFGLCRDVLVGLRLVKRDRMKWKRGVGTASVEFKNPISFLSQYITITGIDPRYRGDRIGAQKRLTY